jgi:four helix bundle protein
MLRADASRLVVHAVACEVARDVTLLAKGLDGQLSNAHRDQLLKSCLSVPSNIAEACGQATSRQFCRFIGHARGSAQELLTQLRLVRPGSRTQRIQLETAQNRTTLVVKLLTRLHAHPPPAR